MKNVAKIIAKVTRTRKEEVCVIPKNEAHLLTDDLHCISCGCETYAVGEQPYEINHFLDCKKVPKNRRKWIRNTWLY